MFMKWNRCRKVRVQSQEKRKLPWNIKLFKSLREQGLFSILIQKGIALSQAVILITRAFEELERGQPNKTWIPIGVKNGQNMAYRSNAGMVGQHESAGTMTCRDIWTGFRDSNMNACGTPRDEVGHATLFDTQQAFVNVAWVGLSLDDIEGREIATALCGHSRHHHVFWLKQTSHHIVNRRLGCIQLHFIHRAWMKRSVACA